MVTLEELGTVVSSAVAQPYVMAIVVPLTFYLVGAFSKKIIRDGTSAKSFFVLADWYLAPDALLVSIGSMLAEFAGLLAKFDAENHHGQIRGVVVLIAISICAYVVVLALHRHYESTERNSVAARCGWLVIFANLMALAVMSMWLVAVKGV